MLNFSMRRRWSLVAVAALSLAPTASARITPPPLTSPDRWATITHANNAPFQFVGEDGPQSVGAVAYEYQISKFEVTHSEWLDFVVAYAPYVPAGDRFRSDFTGPYTFWTNTPTGPRYFTAHGAENQAIEASWRYAARFCNWLHNNKVNAQWAFGSGAYDTSTFSDNPDRSFNDQRAHSPGARYWIPTEDEWVKAAYFDPDRFGDNLPGYWAYPTTSDTAPIPGPPGIGQTNAFTSEEYPVGAYTGVVSPWGLYDMSGGVQEWLETVQFRNGVEGPTGRRIRGSGWGFDAYYDQITLHTASTPRSGGPTLRLAHAVPTPSTLAGAAVIGVSLLSRRRPKIG